MDDRELSARLEAIEIALKEVLKILSEEVEEEVEIEPKRMRAKSPTQ